MNKRLAFKIIAISMAAFQFMTAIPVMADTSVSSSVVNESFFSNASVDDHSSATAVTATGNLGTTGTETNYYLDSDVTRTSNINISGTVNLCLNGHTLDLASYGITFTAGAKLVIDDCSASNSGTIKVQGTTNKSVYVYNGSTLVMNGGNIVSSGDFGVYINKSSSFTLNKGNISSATLRCILVRENSTFVMNGGEITGKTYGIELELNGATPSTVTINDGKITGGTYGIYNYKPAYINVKGGEITGTANQALGIIAKNNYVQLSGGKLVTKSTSVNSAIKVDNQTSDSLLATGCSYYSSNTSVVAADDISNLKTVYVKETAKTLKFGDDYTDFCFLNDSYTLPTKINDRSVQSYLIGGNSYNPGANVVIKSSMVNSSNEVVITVTYVAEEEETFDPSHEHNGWKKVTSTSSTLGVADTETYYVVDSDITSSYNLTIKGTVHLCLNGHTLNLGAKSFICDSGSTLIIDDCSNPSVGKVAGANANMVLVKNGGSFVLNNGILENTGTGHIIYNDGTSAANITINGGKLRKNGTSGDVIQIGYSSTPSAIGQNVIINGGSIIQDNTGKSGAAIALKSSTSYLKVSGDDTVISAKSAEAMYLSRCKADIEGGNISIVSGAQSTNYTVSIDNGTVCHITGGSIVANNSKLAVYANNSSNLTMDGGTISSPNFWGVYIYKSLFVMNDGTISSDSSHGCYIDYGSTFEMNGGLITTNTGNGLLVRNSSTFEMNGGEIISTSGTVGLQIQAGTNNTPDVHASATINNGKISGKSNGISINNNEELTVNGGEICGVAAVALVVGADTCTVKLSGGKFYSEDSSKKAIQIPATMTMASILADSEQYGYYKSATDSTEITNYNTNTICIFDKSDVATLRFGDITTDTCFFNGKYLLPYSLTNSSGSSVAVKNYVIGGVTYLPGSEVEITSSLVDATSGEILITVVERAADEVVNVSLVTNAGTVDGTVKLIGGRLPAIASVGTTKYQVAYYKINGAEKKYQPLDAGYVLTDDTTIVAYAVETISFYEGNASADVSAVKNLNTVLFVNPSSTFTDTTSDSYGLSPNTAFASMKEAGEYINSLCEGSYSTMKNRTYAVILCGSSTYYLTDLETNMSQSTGETVSNPAKTAIKYYKHYQSPTIYMSSKWLDKTYSGKLMLAATEAGAGYSEEYINAKGDVAYATKNRTVLYNDLIIDNINVVNDSHLFANGYRFIATENITKSTATDGSPRQHGIPEGYPRITLSGGTVANDDQVDRNIAGSSRNPEGPRAEIILLGGKWGRVAGGSRSISSTVSYESSIVVGGDSEVGTLAVAAVESSYTGDSRALITGNASVYYLIGSTESWPISLNECNVRTGNSVITIDGEGVTVKELYGGTMGRYSTWTYQVGDTSINVKAGKVESLWGGSAAGQTVGNITINVSGGTVDSLYGAGSSKSPMILDSTDTMSYSAVDSYGDKTNNGYNIIAYNAEKHNVTNLGNTYGIVRINITGGTVTKSLHAGGMGYDYEGDPNYNNGVSGDGVKDVVGFYNIAQVCNHGSWDSVNKVVVVDSTCNKCHSGTSSLDASSKLCDDNGGAVHIYVSGGTIEGDVFAGGMGSERSNRIALICGDTYFVATGGNIKGNVFGAGEYGFVSGNSNVVIEGGVFGTAGNPDTGYIHGAGKNGSISGNSSVYVENATIPGDIYGGGHAGEVGGNSSVEVKNVTVTGDIYGGSEGSHVKGDSSVIISGSSTVGDIYGGSEHGVTGGKTSVVIKGDSNSIGDIFGGGNGAESQVLNGSSVTITGSSVTGDVYGGGNQGTVTGGTKVTIASAKIKKNTEAGTGGNVFGGGNGSAATVTGDCTVVITGESVIEGKVFGGGNAGNIVTGSTMVNVSGKSTFEDDIYAGGNSGNVDGSCYLVVNGSDGATFKNLYSACNSGNSKSAYVNITNIDNDQISGSIYSCGTGTSEKSAQIEGSVNFKLVNVTLSASDGKYVYLGGTENGYVQKDIYVTTQNADVTYLNMYGCYDEASGGYTTKDFTMTVLSGDDATFEGAKNVTTNASEDGVVTLGNGSYLFSSGIAREAQSVIKMANLRLDGTITIQMYALLDPTQVDFSSVYMRYQVIRAAGVTEKMVRLDSSDYIVYGGQKYYRFPLELSAKEMTDEVKAVIWDSEGPYSKEITYSVQTYCDRMLSKSSTNKNLENLIFALLDYGTAAQKYFNYKTSNLADSILEGNDDYNSEYLWYSSIKMGEINKDEYAADVPEGIKINLSLKSEIALNVLVPKSMCNNNPTGYKLTYDSDGKGGEAYLEEYNDDYYFASITGIVAKDLDKKYIIIIEKDGIYICDSFCYGPFSYAFDESIEDVENLRDLMDKMVCFQIYASEYFKAKYGE